MPPGKALAAEPYRRVEKLFRHSTLGPYAARDPVMKHFIEARHCGHQGGRDLDQIVRDLVGALAIPDLGHDLEGKMHPGGMFIGMRQWQQRQEPLVFEDIALGKKLNRRLDVGLDRPVCQHHPLGAAASAGSVDETAHIIRLLGTDPLVKIRQRLGAGNGSIPELQLWPQAIRGGNSST